MWLRRAFGVIGGLLLIAAMWRFRALLGYMLAALALSFVGRPLVRWVSKVQIRNRPIPSGIGAALALATMVTAVGAFVQLFAPLIADQAAAIQQLDPQSLQQVFSTVSDWLDEDLASIDLSGQGTPNSAYLLSQAQGLVQVDGMSSLFGGVLDIIGNLFVAVFSILFMAFFFLRDAALYRKIIFSLTPDRNVEKVELILDRTTRLLTRYFGGLVIQVIIITSIVAVGTAIAGAEHAFLIGLMAGIFNLIPYIGPLAGAGLGILLIATTHSGSIGALPAVVGGSALAFLLAQIVDNFFTQPFIFSNRVNAHPLEIFVVISVAGSLGGPAGMVLAIPGYTLFRIVASETLTGFKVIDRLTASVRESEGDVEKNSEQPVHNR